MKIYLILFLLCLIGCNSIPTYSQNTQITEERFQGRVKIGMTREQVKEKWGAPDQIINKQGKDFDEIWIYVPHWKFKNYLYFKNGILVRGDPDPEDII